MLVRLALATFAALTLMAITFVASVSNADPLPVKPTSILIRPATSFPPVQLRFELPPAPAAFKLPLLRPTQLPDVPLASHPEGLVIFRVSF